MAKFPFSVKNNERKVIANCIYLVDAVAVMNRVPESVITYRGRTLWNRKLRGSAPFPLVSSAYTDLQETLRAEANKRMADADARYKAAQAEAAKGEAT